MKIGDAIKYHSPYRTGVYDGTITALNGDGTVAIAVEIPSMAKPKRKSKHYNMMDDMIELRSVTYGPNGLARPI